MALIPLAAQEAGQSNPSPIDEFGAALVWSAPHALMNGVPGFGLGSLAQADSRGFRRLLIVDSVSVTLLAVGFGLPHLTTSEWQRELGFLAVAAGSWGVFGGRVLGVARPFVYSIREGVNRDSLLAPITYNLVPGFGFGSRVQGDTDGARIGRILDTAILGPSLLLAVMFADLWMPPELNRVLLIGFTTGFAASKTYQIARPLRFRAQQRIAERQIARRS